MSTTVNKQKVKEVHNSMKHLSGPAQLKVLDELQSRKENELIGDVVNTIAESFTTADLAALRRKITGSMKKRSRKDPNAPKGASGAFIFFSKERVQQLKESEGLGHKDATKRAGALWKELSDEEKLPYYEMAKADKVRATEAMSKYELEHVEDVDESKETEKKRRKKAKKDPNAPKKNSNAFMFYSKDRVPELKATGLTHPNATKQAGLDWHTLSADQKRPYEESAAQDKARYAREMEAYNSEHGEAAPSTPASSVPAKKQAPKAPKPAASTPASVPASASSKPAAAKSGGAAQGKPAGTKKAAGTAPAKK